MSQHAPESEPGEEPTDVQSSENRDVASKQSTSTGEGESFESIGDSGPTNSLATVTEDLPGIDSVVLEQARHALDVQERPGPKVTEIQPEMAKISSVPSTGELVSSSQKSGAKKVYTSQKNVVNKKKPTRLNWIAGAAAVVVLVSGGAFLGHTLTDPTKSDEYASLSEAKQGVDEKLDSQIASYGKLRGEYNTLFEAGAEKERDLTSREATLSTDKTKLAEDQAALKKREDAVKGAEATKAKNTVTEGTWTVGRDINPGTYVASLDVGSSCYWGIYASGSNGDNIIENDIPGGGRPTVTLSVGQDFKSSRCGSWIKR